ncbi:MAG: GNAT family N-acetyltransferase [Christensenellales bacterium]
MIRQALPGDRPQIEALWMQAFHDSREATSFYFAHRHQDRFMLVDVQDDQLRAMLSLLPVDLVMGDLSFPARYFFAIATDIAWRGQGISTQLIQAAEAFSQGEGAAASVLVPADADLFTFYRKRGYETRFYYHELRLEAGSLPPAPPHRLLPPTAAELLRLRGEAFRGSRLFLRWDEEALAYILLASQTYHAPLLRFLTDAGEGYASCEWAGKELIVKELALSGIPVREAAAILLSHLGAGSCTLRLAGGDLDPAGLRPFGMLKAFLPLPEAPGELPYMSFAKD